MTKKQKAIEEPKVSTFKIAWRNAAGHTSEVQIKDHKTFESFVGTLVKTIEGHKKNKTLKDKSDGQWFLRGPAIRRNNKDLKNANIIVADIDKTKVRPDLCHELLKKLSVTHFIYTSSSHTKEKPRYRIVVPFESKTDQANKRATAYLQSLIPDIHFAPESYTWSQEWYLPINGAEQFGYIGIFKVPADFKYEGKIKLKKEDSDEEIETDLDLDYEKHRKALESGEEIHPHSRGMTLALANGGLSANMIFNVVWPEVEKALNKRGIDDHEVRMASTKELADSAVKKVSDEKKGKNEGIEEKDIAKPSDIAEGIVVDRLPAELLAPDDLYGELVESLYKTMWRPNIMSAHVATDGIIAYMAGGKYSGENKKDRVNIFELVSGDSGDGKGIVVEGPGDVMTYLNCSNINYKIGMGITSDIGSAQAIDQLFIACEKRPDILYCWDEFGDALIEFSSNGANSEKTKIISKAKELWSVSDQARSERSLVSNHKNGIEPKTFYAPHFSIVGAGTEDSIAQGVDVGKLADGFFSRILLMPSLPYSEGPRKNPCNLSLSSSLTESLMKLHAEKIPQGNLYTAETARVQNPVIVKWNDEVKEYFHKIALELHDMPTSLDRTLSNRKIVNVKKKAMIRALINDPLKPVVTMEIACWANDIVTHSIEYSGKLFKDRLHYSQFDAAVTAIVNYLKKNQGKWVKKEKIMNLNQIRKLGTKAQIDGALGHLLSKHSSNVDVGESAPSRGKKAPLYKWVD